MEFIHLVSHGPWKQVWLAAHFDKKVKPEDVFLADIEKITASVRSRKDVTNLRSTGHLVLGACRIYRRKTEMYESQVTEVRNKLVLAFKTEERKDENETNEEADLVFDMDDAPVQELTSSKSHTARVETTTLPLRPKLANVLDFNEQDVTWENPSDAFDVSALEEELGITQIPIESIPIEALQDPNQPHGPAAPHYTPDMPLEHDIGQEAIPVEDPQDLSPRDRDEVDHPMLSSPIPNELPLPIAPEAASPIPSGAPEDDDPEEDVHKHKKRKLTLGALVDDSVEIPAKVYYQFTTETEPITQKYPRRQDFRLSLNPYKDRFFMDTSLDSSLFLEIFGDALYVDRRNKLLPDKEPVVEIPAFQNFLPNPMSVASGPREPAMDDILLNTALVDKPVQGNMKATAIFDDMSPRKFRNLTMSSVVTGSMDEEEFDGTRVGFSSRTQKMEALVQQEMTRVSEDGICYKEMCRTQGSKNRHLIAACFFELLVLKTNGVIEVKQSKPYSNIMITEGHKWMQPVSHGPADVAVESAPLTL
eukprot:GEMP01019983.1.p1 GENE.GEMP01019983.1~~GEMP01019983.1.p1  ORF type:complete len:533 (+),score=100.28 GEMP01019983.1:75-1673(+)